MKSKRTPHTNGTLSKEDYKTALLAKIDEASAELASLKVLIDTEQTDEAITAVQDIDRTMLDIEEQLDHYAELE